MDYTEVQSIIKDAKEAKRKSFIKNRPLSDGLKVEINNFERKIEDIMSKPYNKLTDLDEIPDAIEKGADHLKSCHTL